MNSTAPSSAFPGGSENPGMFSRLLTHEMDSDRSKLSDKPGHAAAESKIGGKSATAPAPETTESARDGQKTKPTSNGFSLAVAAAPVQVHAEAETSGAMASRADRAGVSPNREASLVQSSHGVGEDDFQLPSQPASAVCGVEVKSTGDSAATQKPTAGFYSQSGAQSSDPPAEAPQFAVATRESLLDLPPRPVAGDPGRLPERASHDPARNAGADLGQTHVGMLECATADLKTIAASSARLVSPQDRLVVAAHLQTNPTIGYTKNSEATVAASDRPSKQEPASQSNLGEKQNAAAPATRSRGGDPPSEEKSPADKAPANLRNFAPSDVPSAAPHLDAQSAKPLLAEGNGVQAPHAAASSGPVSSPLGGPPAALASVKPDAQNSGPMNSVAPPPEPAPFHAARVIQEGNSSEMRVGLRMEAFGAVQVHTTVSEKQVELAVGSERGDLRGLITGDLPSLQTSLQQHDLHLHEVRTLEQASPGRNPADHSSGHSDEDGRQQQFARPRFWVEDSHRSSEAGDVEVSATARGLSIRA